jgi:hypothetical protein
MTPTDTEFALRDHIKGATEMHSKFRRAKRLMLILAGTAALSGTLAPVAALADPAPPSPPAKPATSASRVVHQDFTISMTMGCATP